MLDLAGLNIYPAESSTYYICLVSYKFLKFTQAILNLAKLYVLPYFLPQHSRFLTTINVKFITQSCQLWSTNAIGNHGKWHQRWDQEPGLTTLASSNLRADLSWTTWEGETKDPVLGLHLSIPNKVQTTNGHQSLPPNNFPHLYTLFILERRMFGGPQR